MGSRMMAMIDAYFVQQEKLVNANFIQFLQQQKAGWS